MLAVIFEVVPADGQTGVYLDLAAELRPLLSQVDGFISVERFQSLSTPGKILSLSLWRDEAAVAAWRRRVEHRAAQRQGRRSVFREYRIRVAEVLRDYTMDDRREAPADDPDAPV